VPDIPSFFSCGVFVVAAPAVCAGPAEEERRGKPGDPRARHADLEPFGRVEAFAGHQGGEHADEISERDDGQELPEAGQVLSGLPPGGGGREMRRIRVAGAGTPVSSEGGSRLGEPQPLRLS